MNISTVIHALIKDPSLIAANGSVYLFYVPYTGNLRRLELGVDTYYKKLKMDESETGAVPLNLLLSEEWATGTRDEIIVPVLDKLNAEIEKLNTLK